MTIQVSEPESSGSGTVEGAVADTAESVASAVADVATDAMRVLQEENTQLRSRVASLEFDVTRLTNELAESKREPEITVVNIVEEPTIVEGDVVTGGESPAVESENTPVTEPVTAVESPTLESESTSETSESEKKDKGRSSKRRRRGYGKR